MDQQQAADVLRNLDLRTRRMEQILPDLPTRAEMREAIDTSIRTAVAPLATREEMHEAIQAAVAPLATKEELAQAIAPLATKEELAQAVAPLATRDELRQGLSDLRDELRRHMDVWAERIHDDVKMAFDGIRMVDEKHTRNYEDLRQRLVELIRTEAQHHVGTTKRLEELREYWREYVKTHAKEHAEIRKRIEAVSAARAAKLERKPRRRKAS